MYRSELILNLITHLYFKKPDSLGNRYADHFDPIPIPLIAYICTLVSHKHLKLSTVS